jgi:hypothetical protein
MAPQALEIAQNGLGIGVASPCSKQSRFRASMRPTDPPADRAQRGERVARSRDQPRRRRDRLAGAGPHCCRSGRGLLPGPMDDALVAGRPSRARCMASAGPLARGRPYVLTGGLSWKPRSPRAGTRSHAWRQSPRSARFSIISSSVTWARSERGRERPKARSTDRETSGTGARKLPSVVLPQ